MKTVTHTRHVESDETREVLEGEDVLPQITRSIIDITQSIERTGKVFEEIHSYLQTGTPSEITRKSSLFELLMVKSGLTGRLASVEKMITGLGTSSTPVENKKTSTKEQNNGTIRPV